MNNNNNIIGLYVINGIVKTNKIRINHIGNTVLKKDMTIKDQKIKDYPIKKLDVGMVTGYVYKSTITHHYISSSKRLPLFYINVSWIRPMQIIPLYNIMVYFNITSKINSAKDLFNKKIKGVFSIHAIIDNKNIPLKENITKYPGDAQIIADLEKLTVMEGMIDYLHDIIDQKQKEIAEKYGTLDYKIPTNIIKLEDIDTD